MDMSPHKKYIENLSLEPEAAKIQQELSLKTGGAVLSGDKSPGGGSMDEISRISHELFGEEGEEQQHLCARR